MPPEPISQDPKTQAQVAALLTARAIERAEADLAPTLRGYRHAFLELQRAKGRRSLARDAQRAAEEALLAANRDTHAKEEALGEALRAVQNALVLGLTPDSVVSDPREEVTGGDALSDVSGV